MRRGIWLSALLCATHICASSASAQASRPAAPSQGAEHLTLGVTLAIPGAGVTLCGTQPASEPQAACVLSFQPGSAAQRAGFQVGDLIRRFGTVHVATPVDVIDAVAAAQVGERVAVVVERNGQRVELQVEFMAADVRGPPHAVASATGTVRTPAVDLCATPSDEESSGGVWRPPYERLPLPADAGELLALVDDADTAVVAEGSVLSIVRRDAREALNVTGTFQCPMTKIPGHDVWALQLRMASWDTAFFSYAFRSASGPAFDGLRSFRGADAPLLPVEKETLAGRLIETSIASRQLSEQRSITVYLPPGASEPDMPALFMTDGQAVSQYARVLEPLIRSGAVRPLAIVGVHSGQGERRAREYLSGVDDDAFAKHLTFFVDEVLPWASAEYGISSERRDRALFGYSNGAAFATTVGVERPELFANVLPFSTGWRIEKRPAAGVELPRFFFAAGELEPYVTPTRAAYEVVQSTGAVSSFDVYRSGHDPLLWSMALVDIIPRVFAERP